MKDRILFHVGNVLIFLSIIGLVLTFLPIVRGRAPRSDREVLQIMDNGPTILIPKIGAVSNIFFDVDPWTRSEYESVLENGVAHAKGSSKPWEAGTSYIFAHSSLPPWKMTRTNTPFLYLGQLDNGDKISIVNDRQEYVFEVESKEIVWPNEVQYLVNRSDLNQSRLILQTCTPIGTSLKRLLVFAKRIDLGIK